MGNRPTDSKPDISIGMHNSFLPHKIDVFPIYSMDTSRSPPEINSRSRGAFKRRMDAQVCMYFGELKRYFEKWRAYDELFGEKSEFYKNLPEKFREPVDCLV